MATTTKRTKVTEHTPPLEIREVTKVRRQWLADKVEALKAKPNTDAKIIGLGSYQTVAEYRLEDVACRMQTRATCQFCGNDQALDKAGFLVLHGYERPGHGWINGRCSGAGLRPMETTDQDARRFEADYQHTETCLTAELPRREKALRAARNARYAADTDGTETYRDAHAALPQRPRRGFGVKLTAEEEATYQAAKATWAAAFPKAAALDKAEQAHGTTEQALWRTQQMVKHFAELLARGLVGQPFREVPVR